MYNLSHPQNELAIIAERQARRHKAAADARLVRDARSQRAVADRSSPRLRRLARAGTALILGWRRRSSGIPRGIDGVRAAGRVDPRQA